MTRHSSTRAAGWLLIAATVVGCATNTARAPTLSPAFYGVWTNVNPNFYNWWEISEAGAVNYGIALDQGKCGARAAIVLGPDSLEVPFGNAGLVHLNLSGAGFLVFNTDRGRALHKPVGLTDICRKSDGTYFEGAPHVGHAP